MRLRPRTTLSIALVATLAIAPTSLAQAAENAWDEPITLSDVSGQAENPQVVTDGTRITAAWQRYDFDTDRIEIQTAYSLDAGATWSSPVSLSGDGVDLDNAENVRLVSDGNTITAVWSESDGAESQIRSSSTTDGGENWNGPIVVSSTSDTLFNLPLIVTDGSLITVVWESRDRDDRFAVLSSYSEDGGTTWSTAAPVPGADAIATEEIVLVSDGISVTAAWTPATRDLVLTSTSGDGGETWSAPQDISNGLPFLESVVAIADSSQVVIGWRYADQDDGTLSGLFVSRSVDGGDNWNAPVLVSELGQRTENPALASGGSLLVMTWTDSFTSDGQIYFARSTDGGLNWSEPAVISAPETFAADAQVVTDGTVVTVVWNRQGEGGPAVLAVRSTDGGVTWGPLEVLSSPGVDADRPKIVTDGTTTTVVWERSADAGPDQFIEATSFTVAAVIVDPEPEPEPEPEPDPEPEPEPQPEPEPDTGNVGEDDTGGDTGAGDDGGAGTDPDTESAPQPELSATGASDVTGLAGLAGALLLGGGLLAYGATRLRNQENSVS